jgi:hypothetical protein
MSKIGCRIDSVQFARLLVWLNYFVIAVSRPNDAESAA